MKKRMMYTWSALTMVCLGALMIIGVANASAEEQTDQQEVDLVWTKSDGIRPEIFYTTRVAGSWSEPVMVTDDWYDNMHPVIDRESNGTRWVFWTAYDNYRTEIRYTTGSGENWEENEPLASDMKSNSGPSAVIDEDDAVWVVWSASDEDGLDDIYFAVNKDGQWSDPNMIHEANDIPDTLPVVELGEEGVPTVTWKQLGGDDYVELTTSYDGSDWSQPVVSENQDEPTDENSIVLPDFVNESGMVFIRAY